ncbi:hypothetical protein V512_015145 [Mesotoga sp. Brook.08.105.5.1]|nr:hypothetical protein V512_015145 [Mesotoga sp. Brook.08.105.5.1]
MMLGGTNPDNCRQDQKREDPLGRAPYLKKIVEFHAELWLSISLFV